MKDAHRSDNYAAAEGREDRHGEMTGAISFNMVLCMPPVCIWAVFVGPAVFEALWPTLVVAVALAVVLPIALLPLSRRLWVRFSRWSDRV